MRTIALKILVEERYQEFLIAELTDLDFEAFEDREEYLVAYIPSSRWDNVKREHIERWLAAHDQPVELSEEIIQDENWNKAWEETIEPVAVPPFLIKPTWRDVPPEHNDLIVLEIDPKMSFGTGYHESTRLMLRLLPDHLNEADHVLDAGTGTGILAIASVRIGAGRVDAFDIDEWSQRNAVENVYLNGVQEAIHIYEGSIDVVPSAQYDLILANINLNVIVGLLTRFTERLRPGGRLLISGVLTRDRGRVVEEAESRGLRLRDEREEGEWWAIVAQPADDG